MVVDPAETPITNPESFIVATDILEEVHGFDDDGLFELDN